MFRTIITVTVLSLMIIVCPVAAQANDISILAGAYTPSFNIGTQPSPISVSTGASVQLGYAHRLLPIKGANLDLDVPLTITTQHDGSTGWGLSASNQTNIFFTPGIRYRLESQTRISPFLVFGGGVGSFGNVEARVGSGLSLRAERIVSPVLDFGGGADFRITQLLSLRGEVRDFISRAGLGGTQGRHHPVFVVGLGFHFN